MNLINNYSGINSFSGILFVATMDELLWPRSDRSQIMAAVSGTPMIELCQIPERKGRESGAQDIIAGRLGRDDGSWVISCVSL